MLWIARALAACERARIKLGIAMAAMMAITVIRTKQTRAAIAMTTTGGMPARAGAGGGAPRRAPQFWQKPGPSRASFPHDEQNMGSVMRAAGDIDLVDDQQTGNANAECSHESSPD